MQKNVDKQLFLSRPAHLVSHQNRSSLLISDGSPTILFWVPVWELQKIVHGYGLCCVLKVTNCACKTASCSIFHLAFD